MQRNYNDRNGVRKLHPLGVGDRVRIKTDKEKYWSDSGVVKSADYNARSYIVQTPRGLLRRNRIHIQHTGYDRPLVAHSDLPYHPYDVAQDDRTTPPGDAHVPKMSQSMNIPRGDHSDIAVSRSSEYRTARSLLRTIRNYNKEWPYHYQAKEI